MIIHIEITSSRDVILYEDNILYDINCLIDTYMYV